MDGGFARLDRWFRSADKIDITEGQQAYPRYREVMVLFAERYGFPLDRVAAAFVALSPNTDYLSNLRSLVSVLSGVRDGTPDKRVTVSTYNHNKHRAISYLRGETSFVSPSRGRKILSFYDNILHPDTSGKVTVDGHMVAVWRNENLTMKEATVGRREYTEIENEVRRFAFYHHMRPCQMQAILWFVRKRLLGIKFDAQLGLFSDASDQWGTLRLAEGLQPYKLAA